MVFSGERCCIRGPAWVRPNGGTWLRWLRWLKRVGWWARRGSGVEAVLRTVRATRHRWAASTNDGIQPTRECCYVRLAPPGPCSASQPTRCSSSSHTRRAGHAATACCGRVYAGCVRSTGLTGRGDHMVKPWNAWAWQPALGAKRTRRDPQGRHRQPPQLWLCEGRVGDDESAAWVRSRNHASAPRRVASRPWRVDASSPVARPGPRTPIEIANNLSSNIDGTWSALVIALGSKVAGPAQPALPATALQARGWYFT